MQSIENSKLLRLFKSLNTKEKRLLKKWIKSPIHNQHKNVEKLIEYLFSRNKLKGLALDKKRIFKQLFPTKEYDVYALNHVLSYTYECLDQFIGFLELKNDDFLTKKLQIQAYENHNLMDWARQELQVLETQVHSPSEKDANYHAQALELEIKKFEWAGTQFRTKANNLPQIFTHLSEYFVIQILYHACIASSHQSVYKTTYEIPMLEAALAYAESSKASPLAYLYKLSYQTLTRQIKEDDYAKFFVKFKQHAQELTAKDRRNILLSMINYSIRKAHTGEEKFIREAFELYQLGLETKTLLEQNILSKFAYKNIVALGLKLNEFDWIEQFIKEYTEYLDPKNQENYKHYVTAKLHFSRQEYHICMPLLTQVEYDDIFLNLSAKIMLLKIYYTENSLDALEALLKSFTVFLQRKDILSYHKTNYMNIIRLTRRLVNIPHFKDKQNIQNAIEQTQPLTEKEWLLEQLEKK